MREIKFRGWIKEAQKMVHHLESRYYPQWFTTRAEYLMQYTGFKDKADKEIYEGDIVKFIYRWGESFTCNDVLIGQVRFDEMTGCYIFGTAELSFLDDIYDLEVIGNIYENPEIEEIPK